MLKESNKISIQISRDINISITSRIGSQIKQMRYKESKYKHFDILSTEYSLEHTKTVS